MASLVFPDEKGRNRRSVSCWLRGWRATPHFPPFPFRADMLLFVLRKERARDRFAIRNSCFPLCGAIVSTRDFSLWRTCRGVAAGRAGRTREGMPYLARSVDAGRVVHGMARGDLLETRKQSRSLAAWTCVCLGGQRWCMPAADIGRGEPSCHMVGWSHCIKIRQGLGASGRAGISED